MRQSKAAAIAGVSLQLSRCHWGHRATGARDCHSTHLSWRRFSELVALYQRKGQHEVALDLLYRLSQAPENLPVPPQGEPLHAEPKHGFTSWCPVRHCWAPEASPSKPAWSATFYGGKLCTGSAGAAAELAGLTGVWAAVRYLVEAGGRHPSLVKKHSRCTRTEWCLVCSTLCTTCLAHATLIVNKLPQSLPV